jgi:hypothetical protein
LDNFIGAEGRQQLKAGKGLSTQEAKKKLKKWLK